jgi:two-component sensor histidine kinase
MQVGGRRDAVVHFLRTLPRTGSIVAFVLSGVVIVACALLKVALDAWVGSDLPYFITFYPAVVIASMLGGPGVGLAAAATTLGLAWFFWVPPSLSFALNDKVSVAIVATFGVTAPLIAVCVGAVRQSLDRAAASEAQRWTAARESVHRTKNLIAVVQAISAKVAQEVDTVAEFSKVMDQRLHALSLAQDLLLRREWQEAELEELLHAALAPFLPNPGLTIRSGERVNVPAHHVRGLCMALYELCTNAMKYGALAYGRGPVTISWHLLGNACVLEWREELGASRIPDEAGFGTTLIRMALSHEAGTSVHYEVDGQRVLASFRWPATAPARQSQGRETHTGEQALSRPPRFTTQASAAAV